MMIRRSIWGIRFSCLFLAFTLLSSLTALSFAESTSGSSFVVEYYLNLKDKEKKPYSAQIMEAGKRHIIQDQFPSVDYVNFMGWSTDKKATEAEYFPGDVFLGDSTTKLYAIWGEPYDLGEISESCTIEHASLSVSDSVWFTFTVPEEAYYHFFTTNRIKQKGASSGTGIYYSKKSKRKNVNIETLVRDTDLTKENIDLLGSLSPKNTYYLGIYIPEGEKMVLQCEIIGN